jgi:signal transduction histidine kinase
MLGGLQHDLIVIINRELSACNAPFRDTKRYEFRVTRVRDADSSLRLAKHNTTQGWSPIEAKIQISDAVGVAGMLGGEVLYGPDAEFVSIRELIQNAVDAIAARRYFERSSVFDGKVLVRLKRETRDVHDGYWVDVVDDGIGMSESVLTGPLIDFGTSS